MRRGSTRSRQPGRPSALGFESIWLVDHVHTSPEVTDEITLESFTGLSALAAETTRIRLGHSVVCTAWRNPAITAKMISTMDVISGGRMTLGLGAGWKQDEWEAYGYDFPPAPERLRILGDHLEVITAMLAPGRATVETSTARVSGAVNEPKGVQRPRVPVMVGGNGPQVTWRLAARYADELNLDGMTPDDVEAAMPVIRQRCEEIGRDPATLRISALTWIERVGAPGAERSRHAAPLRRRGPRQAHDPTRFGKHRPRRSRRAGAGRRRRRPDDPVRRDTAAPGGRGHARS